MRLVLRLQNGWSTPVQYLREGTVRVRLNLSAVANGGAFLYLYDRQKNQRLYDRYIEEAARQEDTRRAQRLRENDGAEAGGEEGGSPC